VSPLSLAFGLARFAARLRAFCEAPIKATPFWRVWTADAEASLHDMRALSRYRFDAERYRSLRMAVQPSPMLSPPSCPTCASPTSRARRTRA
jgi:hypothetical protein